MRPGVESESPTVQKRRKAMRDFMAAHDLKPSDWARQAGLPSANVLYNFLNGRSASLNQATLERLVRAIPGATVTQVIGEHASRTLNVIVMNARAIAEANVWRASYENQLDAEVEIALPPRLSADEIVKIGDNHANTIYPRGSFVAVQGLASMARDVRGGDKVLVHRAKAGRHEITVREVRELDEGAGACLVFCSNVEALIAHELKPKGRGKDRVVLPLPWPYRGELFDDDGCRVQVRGRVVMMTMVHDTTD